MSETDSQTKILTDGLASISKAQAREINEFLDNREAKAISVGDLLKQDYKYFIPNYQRGYRWTSLEVKTLLRDIEAASKDKKHCLQPLVLQKREGDKAHEYAVIDGQQRLTTISIILAWCNQKEKATCERPSIEYETRTGSLSFLENIMDKTEGDAEANVDFWNMYQAYVCCEEYAKGKENIVSIIKENLLNHCSFILYIAREGENEHEIFKRLNSGKIALTNAELTKALLLHDRPNEEQLEMALKWDEMMHFFENDDFWYFICPEPESEKYQQTRLDFLIELVAGTESGTGGDRYASFRALDTTIRKGGSITAKWKELIRFYHIMRYWYEDTPHRRRGDSSLYHLVGFIIHENIKDKEVKDLLSLFGDKTRKLFKESCLNIIKKNLKFGGKEITDKNSLAEIVAELNYGEHNPYISQLLLLMNIATLEKSLGENSRYPFAAHVCEKWSLEHIHARNEKASADSIKAYLSLVAPDKYTQNEINDEDIETRYNECRRKFEQMYVNGDFSYETSFGNLALLPRDFNSSLSNKWYRDKRQQIANNQKNAILPICTRYAFFKYYSPNDDSNIVWNGKNAYDYTEKAIDLISKYLNLEK